MRFSKTKHRAPTYVFEYHSLFCLTDMTASDQNLHKALKHFPAHVLCSYCVVDRVELQNSHEGLKQ